MVCSYITDLIKPIDFYLLRLVYSNLRPRAKGIKEEKRKRLKKRKGVLFKILLFSFTLIPS
jgi:hypothetical protein